MSRLLTITAFFAFVLAFTNCNKCQSCQFEYEVNDSTYFYHSGSYCGNNGDLKEFKEECTENANIYGVEPEFVEE